MKLSLKAAAIYRPKPSSITHRPPLHRLSQKPLTEPAKIDTARHRWLAVLTAASCERRVADELTALGFKAYCPLGRRLVSWQGGRQLKQKLVREFPVFSRYLFVGLPTGFTLGRHLSDKIVSILGDASGPVVIPPAAIARINALELAGEWDETKMRRSPYQPGVSVSIPRGPYAGFLATIDAQESETRLRVLVNMFGRQSAVSVDLAQVELVA